MRKAILFFFLKKQNLGGRSSGEQRLRSDPKLRLFPYRILHLRRSPIILFGLWNRQRERAEAAYFLAETVESY
jgi:hypothetical protein